LVAITPSEEIFRRDRTERLRVARVFNRSDVPLAGIKYYARLKSRRDIVNVSSRRIRLCTYSLRAGWLAKKNEAEKAGARERERERERGGGRARKGEQSWYIACIAHVMRLDEGQTVDRTYYVIVHVSCRIHARQNRGCKRMHEARVTANSSRIADGFLTNSQRFSDRTKSVDERVSSACRKNKEDQSACCSIAAADSLTV